MTDSIGSKPQAISSSFFYGPLSQGGATDSAANDFTPVRVSKLYVGEPAYECGMLFVGDEIVAVNNVPLHGKPHKEVVKLIQSAGPTVSLTVNSTYDMDAT